MSTDADPVPATKQTASSAPAARKKKKKGGKRTRIVRQLTEPEINAPDTQTLWMVGALAALTIVLWVFAHKGCNYHPPRETRRPRDVTTADLTREPKDAAIEFQHRLITLNHKGALEIASGPLVEEVKKAQASCDSNPAACAEKRKNLGQAITSAVVLERTPLNAKIRVTTYHLPLGNQTFLALVERDMPGWKVTAHISDVPGATLPPPSITPPPSQHPMQLNVAPSGSASPGSNTMRLVPAPGASGNPNTMRLVPAPGSPPPPRPVPAPSASP